MPSFANTPKLRPKSPAALLDTLSMPASGLPPRVGYHHGSMAFHMPPRKTDGMRGIICFLFHCLMTNTRTPFRYFDCDIFHAHATSLTSRLTARLSRVQIGYPLLCPSPCLAASRFYRRPAFRRQQHCRLFYIDDVPRRGDTRDIFQFLARASSATLLRFCQQQFCEFVDTILAAFVCHARLLIRRYAIA